MKCLVSLRNKSEFDRVFRLKRSFANKYLVMYICENQMDLNRLGLSVSKKVGNSVVRHRVTRLIRESYRLNNGCIHKGYDFVIVARSQILGKNYSEVESAFLHLLKLHKIVISSSQSD